MNIKKPVYVGIDFGNEYSQVSYYSDKEKEPVSLGLSGPENGYYIPTVISKAVGKSQWFAGDEAKNSTMLMDTVIVDNLVMKGDDVFNFVLNKVPEQIEKLLLSQNILKDDIDYFMCHQPNKFMLQKLADKLGVCYDKMPNNIVENFGNASGVTIPTNICFNLPDQKNEYRICLSGFGVGLTWASMILNIGKLKIKKIIEYK